MKTSAHIKQYLLFTSFILLISSAVVSLPNKTMRSTAHLTLGAVAIAYTERLKAQQKTVKSDNLSLLKKQHEIKQQLQIATEETKAIVKYTDEEFQRYEDDIAIAKINQKKTEEERDQLKIQLSKLEKQLEIQTHQSSSHRPMLSLVEPSSPSSKSTTNSPLLVAGSGPLIEEPEQVDLSKYRIAIVGGHRKTCQKVLAHLRSDYHLHKTTHIPSQREQSISYSQLHRRLKGRHLIVLVTQYIGHPLKQMVLDLDNKNSIHGDILYVNTKGASSIIREINSYIEQSWLRSA